MIQELLGGTAMEQQQQLKGANGGGANHHVSTMPHGSAAPTSSPTSGQQADQAPLRCPRCNSSNTKFCYYNNYNLTQPRHFCKTCRRYWTKGGALRNVPIGGGCRKPRPMPAPVAKPPASCKSVVGSTGSPLGLGMGTMSWASAPQAASAQLMALLNSATARGLQGHGGEGNMHRLLGLDSMGQLQVLPGTGTLWPHRQMQLADSQLGMSHHDLLSGALGLKPPPSSLSASSYYSDQLNAVVSNGAGAAARSSAYDDPPTSSFPCTTAASMSCVSASPTSFNHVHGMDQAPLSLAAQEMQYWNSPTSAMSMAWPDLPALNGAFP